MCECGVVPVIRRLMKKGLPVSCAVTYLLASPVVNPITAISTLAAFRGQQPGLTVGFRLALSYVVAVIVGLVVTRLRPEQFLNERVPRNASRPRPAYGRLPASARWPGRPRWRSRPSAWRRRKKAAAATLTFPRSTPWRPNLRPTLFRRILAALQRGTNDFLDVAVFVVIGAAVASVFNTAVDQRVIVPMATNPFSAVGALMLLAFLIAVCSTTDAFIAAMFTAFPFTARLAFLVFGPVFDLKLLFLYSLVFRRRFVLALGIGLFVLIGLVCVKLSAIAF